MGGTSTRSGTVASDGVAHQFAFADPAPTLRRARNVPGAVLGVLVVVVCSLVVASLASSSGGRTEVLVVTRLVPAGARISGADLGATGVAAGPRVSGVRSADLGQVVGQVATHDLVPGTLLVRGEVAPPGSLDSHEAVIGLAVKDGDLPGALSPGDHAEVVSTPASVPGASASGTATVAAGTVLVPDAVVRSVAPAADGQASLVSLAVPLAAVPAVAGANAAGAVTLVLIGG